LKIPNFNLYVGIFGVVKCKILEWPWKNWESPNFCSAMHGEFDVENLNFTHREKIIMPRVEIGHKKFNFRVPWRLQKEFQFMFFGGILEKFKNWEKMGISLYMTST
jgi:hypothetical protein